jgi:flavodoxin
MKKKESKSKHNEPKSNLRRVLVVYYSRDGSTRKVAEQIGITVKGSVHIDQIHTRVNYHGKWGYMKAGRDAMFRRTPLIRSMKNTLEYDLIIVGTPNWAGRMAAPVRSYLVKNRDKFKKIAFFCVQGGSGGEKVIAEMQKMHKPVETMIISERDIRSNKYKDKVKDFCNSLK